MNQRSLLLVLAGVAAVGIIIAAVLFSGDLFGTSADKDAPRLGQLAAGFHPDGEDEHGPYVVGPGGQRIYMDEAGRRFIINPDGNRVWVDEDGNPLRDQSGTGGAGKGKRDAGTGGGGSGSAGTEDDSDADDAEDEADEEPTQEPATPPASLTGEVHDDFGSPFSGAQVVVVAEGAEGAEFRATTGDDGRFRFDELPSRVVLKVHAHDQRDNRSRTHTTRLASGDVTLPEPLVLPRDVAIRGVVRLSDTGATAHGAFIHMVDNDPPPGVAGLRGHQARTESDGQFDFSGLAASTFRMTITLEGYVPRILNNVRPPAFLEIELEAGAAIGGVVLGDDDQPIANARITCEFVAEPRQEFTTHARSDAAGHFMLKCQPESQHNTISVRAPGYANYRQTLVRAGTHDMVIRMQRRENADEFCTIRARVVFPDGEAHVFMPWVYDAQGGNIRTDGRFFDHATGEFSLDVPMHAVTLRVASFQFDRIEMAITPVPGGDIDLGTLYFEAGERDLRVRVLDDESGEPILRALLRSGNRSNVTDTEGRTQLVNVKATGVELTVTHHAYATYNDTVDIPEGSPEIEIRLRRGTRELHVRVTDRSDNPLPGARVRLLYARLPADLYDSRVWTTGSEGEALLDGLNAPDPSVIVTLDGYLEHTVKLATHAGADDPPVHVIVLGSGTGLYGVCSAEGTPLPGGVEVEIYDTTKLVAKVLTDSAGRYESDVEPGIYYVGIPGYSYAPRRVEVEADGTEFNIELGPVAHVRGRILRHDGTPHANAGVYVYRRDNLYWTQTIHTDPDGNFEVMNLFPGEWVLTPLKTQGDAAAQFTLPFSLHSPGWTDLNLTLPRAQGVIKGRVTYPGGQPVARARVAVTNLDANFERALLAAYVVTDDDGNYTAERLENGMRMLVRVGGYAQDATTGTAFSEVVTVPSDSTPATADFVVPESGVTFQVSVNRGDGGPLTAGGPLAYLLDDQGRVSGLYFGGGTFNGNVTLRDVVPGTYTLVITWRGMQRAEVQFTVGATAPSLSVQMQPENRG